MRLPTTIPTSSTSSANLRLRETSPGVFRLDHDRARYDDRAVALALAAECLVSRPPATPLRHALPADIVRAKVARLQLTELARLG